MFWRGEDGYENARVGRVFNHRRPARLPTAVLFAENENDVVNAVRFARERGLKISVRAGGHSWAAWSVRDDALLLDLSCMREMALDAETKIARVSPAMQGGAELDPFLAEHDLFFNGGHCPTVGVGGYLLQGGMGWNCRGWGWSCESVVAIDVVTADGELIHANEIENADLFWAARGAGPGFFGIVTRFYLQTRPRPKRLSQSTQVYPMDLYDDVLHWYSTANAQVASNVEVVALALTAPAISNAPVIVLHGVAMTNTEHDARESLAALETCPVIDRALVHEYAQPTTFAIERAEQIRQNPEGHRYAADNAWLEGDAKTIVANLRAAFTTMPTSKTFALWYGMAPLRELPDMALSLQTETYFALYTIWEDERDDEKNRAWLKEQMTRLQPITRGQYLGDSDLTTRSVKFMADENFARLQTLRAHYDPDNLICSYLAMPNARLNVNEWESM